MQSNTQLTFGLLLALGGYLALAIEPELRFGNFRV
jgi:hypothetical protein